MDYRSFSVDQINWNNLSPDNVNAEPLNIFKNQL